MICHVTPQGERPSPGVRNLRALPRAGVQVGAQSRPYRAREATGGEIARYWPRLLHIWPAYGTHHARGGARSIFVLEPLPH